MSSRICSPAEGINVEAFRWERVAGSAPAPAAPTAEPSAELSEELKAARQELERLRVTLVRQTAEAEQRGHAAGRASALAELESEHRAALERLGRGVSELAAVRPRLRREAEADLVRLSLSIAKRVLHRELATDPEAITGVVRAIWDRMDAREIVRLRLSPAEAEAVRRMLSVNPDTARVEVIADAALQTGDVFVDTTRGEADASVRTQLAEIERGFVDLLTRSEA